MLCYSGIFVEVNLKDIYIVDIHNTGNGMGIFQGIDCVISRLIYPSGVATSNIHPHFAFHKLLYIRGIRYAY